VGQEWAKYFTQPTYSSPAVLGNTIVIGSNDGTLYAINHQTKKTLWKVKTRGGIYLSTPAIQDSVIYFAPGDMDPNVYALDMVTGIPRWKNSLNGGLAKGAPGRRDINSMLLIQLRRMSPAHRAKIFAGLNNSKSSPLAKRKAPVSNTILGQTDIIYTGGGIKTSSVAVGKENVFVIQRQLGYTNDLNLEPTSQYDLIAFNKKTGQVSWNFREIINGPQLGYNSSPAIAGDKIFFGWGGGKVYTLDAATGKVLWQDQLDGHIISSPAVADRRLFIGTTMGSLYSLPLDQTALGETFEKSTYVYPNPAKGSVSNIQVFVTEDATVKIVLYNVAQRPILKKSQQVSANNKWTYNWDLENVANGVYFVKVIAKYSNGSKDEKILKIAVLK